jgi:predicted RNA-binding protein
MARFWIAVASREHVKKGVSGCFAQVCHGKPGPLKRMNEGDWIVYYSPTETFGGKEPCRSFTAIGKVNTGDPYLFQMSKDFIPWRRNVTFVQAQDVAIEPLLAKLSFIKDKQRWGFPFRRGCFEIPESDFCVIAQAMKVVVDES